MHVFRHPGTDQERGLLELIEMIPITNEMVEIGSAYGESSELFARSEKVGKITCIDSWDNDREPHFDIRNGNNSKITKLKTSSKEGSTHFEDGTLDGVYIDANHSYRYIKEDIKLWLPKIKKGGWIGGHDFHITFPGVPLAVSEELTGLEPHGKIKFPHVFRDTSWLVLL